MRRARRARRHLCVATVMVLAIAVLTVAGISSPSSISAVKAGAAAACQSDGSTGCIGKLPCSTGHCPSIDVAPSTDLSDGQYVFISATDFPSGDSMRVAICSASPAVSTDPTDPWCLNGEWEANTWTPAQVPIAVDPSQSNLTQVSLPVFSDPAGGGDSPLPSHDILNSKGAGTGFYCDNGADPCVLEVTEEVGTPNDVGNGPPVSTADTAIFPLAFVPQSSGCPSSDPTIQTDSSFSLEHFIPRAVDATCMAAGGAVALNTATDNQSDVTNFTAGGASVAFIDDPGDPAIKAALTGKHYAYIPIAVSATVVGFLAAQNLEGLTPYPLGKFNLTPNMVAGLITSEYQSADGSPEQVGANQVPGFSDNLIPPLSCGALFECPNDQGLQVYNELGYNTFALLNPSPPNVTGPQSFGSFMSNVSSGSSYQVTDWICKAPNTPISVRVDERTSPNGKFENRTVSVTDRNVGGTTLTSAPVGTSIWPPYTTSALPKGPSWVFPTCQGYATFPALASQEADYGESQNPSFQAKSIRSFAYTGQVVPPLTNVPDAGFGVMDSSEADFNGLNSASLQNADGTFVFPSTQNIESAASAATPCVTGCEPGTYTIDYGAAASRTSYPMPDITYALVSTSPQGSRAAPIKDLLTNLVTYSHGSSLPQGYAPLPDAMYQAALSDISSDVIAKAPSPTKPTSPPSTGGGSGTQGGGDGSGSGSNSPDGTLPLTKAEAARIAKQRSHRHSPTGGIPSAATPTGIALLAIDEASRYFLPLVLALGGACLIAGPLLYFVPAYRRRRRPAGGSE